MWNPAGEEELLEDAAAAAAPAAELEVGELTLFVVLICGAPEGVVTCALGVGGDGGLPAAPVAPCTL